MHIMEEENGKAPGDAAELPETTADLPKKTVADVTISKNADSSEAEEKAPESSKVNGICNEVKEEKVEVKEEDEIAEKQVEEKKEEEELPEEKEVEIIKLPSTSVTAEVKQEQEPEPKVESTEDKISEPQDLTVTCTSTFESVPTKASQIERSYSNNKVISISVEQCQTNHISVNNNNNSSNNNVNSIPEDGDRLKKPKQITNRKRSNKSTDSDESFKASYKRSNKFPEMEHVNEDRERTVSEYVEKASGTSLEDLQRNTEKLQQEIHSLSALARAKELEWNDIIRLKKVKEEMYLRLIRKKQVMLLSMGATGRMPDTSSWDFSTENRMTEFFTNDEVSYNRVNPSVSPKPPPRIPSNLTITKSQSNTSQNIQRFLMQPHGSSEPKSNASSLMMVPIVSSTPLSISSTSSTYPPRHHLQTPLKIPIPGERDKMKGSGRNVPVPILPKPNQNVSANEHSPPIGRQGPIVDVKSIIADYRQNHPEQIPRRGRRLKGQPSQNPNFSENLVSSSRGVLSMSSLALGSGSQVRTVGSTSGNDISYLMTGIGQNQETSRPSSADSNRSNSNVPGDVTASGVSFKDVLVQFAKMSQHQQNDRRNSTPPTKSQSSKGPLYPEVTLHPVLPAGSQSPPNPSSSLLHGILTKNNGKIEGSSNARNTTFSPTLARLLTTPERSSISTTITTALRGTGTTTTAARGSGPVSISDLLSTSKNRNELTITPVVSTLQPAKMKEDAANASEEDPEDSADRLVIDESEEQDNRVIEDDEMDTESVPECQGCHMKSAQFVCAGCGNQWYCSRDCQVTAWDEHSEVCSG